MKNLFLRIWHFFFPPKFDPLTGGEEAYEVSNTHSTAQARNDADLIRIRVRNGGTPGKINHRRSSPYHPMHKRFCQHEKACV